MPSMRALQQVTKVVWERLAARTRDHTLLAAACEVVPLGTVRHGSTRRDLLRARDGASPPCESCDGGSKKVPMVIAALPCIFCGGPEEDTGHLRIPCERDEVVARLLCAKIEEFTTDLRIADKAMELMSWKEHGCTWTESLMAGVVPGELKRFK